MACRGICERVRFDKRRYAYGVKRCTYCDVYIQYQDSFCPCCGRKLRSKRKSKYKDHRIQLATHKATVKLISRIPILGQQI
ncbi:MAG TPA: hypothetical protein VNK44_07975 [Candidatus Nitrosotenuis sp.]|nr:hypothetical protein [Candidatus Nitrosotenuis sp.]